MLPEELGECHFAQGDDAKMLHYLTAPAVVRPQPLPDNWSVDSVPRSFYPYPHPYPYPNPYPYPYPCPYTGEHQRGCERVVRHLPPGHSYDPNPLTLTLTQP